jgi:hypothetical protein
VGAVSAGGLGQAARVHRSAKMHRASAHLAIEHRVLRLSNFPLRHELAGPSVIASTAPSVLARFSPLHPMPTCAACARTKAKAPLSSLFAFHIRLHCRISDNTNFLGSAQTFGINFARQKCDHQWLQRLMQTAHCTDIPGAHRGSAEAWLGWFGLKMRQQTPGFGRSP